MVLRHCPYIFPGHHFFLARDVAHGLLGDRLQNALLLGAIRRCEFMTPLDCF